MHNCSMTSFPDDPAKIRWMQNWCREHRGSITRIAEMVVQHDGTRGIVHSAVTRTLAGKERNSLVIAAFRKYHAAVSRLEKQSK